VLLFFVSIKGVNAATTNQLPDLNIINAQEIIAKNAAVYDVTNRKFIYAKNADEPVPMASLVKIITAAVFLQLESERSKQGNGLEKIQIIKKGNGYNQGDRELINGEFWKKENLIRYMLITSSNIAAQSLTNSLIDDEFAFALLMNKMVRDLKYKSFSFKNGSGLSIPNPEYNPKYPNLASKEIPSAIGSAKEIAVLFNSIFTKIPFLGEASVVSDATFVNWSGNTHTIKNVNDSLSKIPHIIAGKTGTTEESGGNLVIIINPNQQKYAIVIMGSTVEDRYIDAIKLATATELFSAINIASTSTSSIPLSTGAFAPLK
jgi:D-alanyl-D-alanine carboxypeptidase (penicillin-binding protein 5/6)